jgi:hypothetical protein
MSLITNIDRIANAAGIESVVVFHPTHSLSPLSRGTTQWHGLLSSAINMLHRSDENTLRIVVGKHTIVVQRESDETAAVVLPTGHPIAKSLRRMIRRAARAKE